MSIVTQVEIKRLFRYDDGELYWKVKNASRIEIGDKTGYINDRGYKITSVNGKYYKTHRLIFLYHYGYLPQYLDHIDRNSLNNHIENLREATNSQNQMNRDKYLLKGKPTLSQYKGVSWHKRDKCWFAQIRIDNKNKFLGNFYDEKAAAFIYNVYAKQIFGEYAVLNNLE